MIVAVDAIHAKMGGALTYLRHVLPAVARLAGPSDKFLVIAREAQRRLLDGGLPGVEFVPVRCPTSPLRSLLWEQARLSALVERLGADLLYCPQNYAPLRCRSPIVLLLSNSLAAARQARGAYRRAYWFSWKRLTRASARSARRVLAVSRTVADETRRLCGLGDRFPVTVIPHGVGPPFTSTAGIAEPHPGTRPLEYFLFVSGIMPHKNILGLIDAFTVVSRLLPDHRLVIIGPELDRAYAREARSRAVRAGIASRVDWMGAVDQEALPGWYRSATSLVVPSFAESFAFPPIEAMACGAPVISARAGALPETCGDAALYFEPKDPAAAGELMFRLGRDSALREEMGRRGVERAGRFGWDASAASLFEILRDVAGSLGGVRSHLKTAMPPLGRRPDGI